MFTLNFPALLDDLVLGIGNLPRPAGPMVPSELTRSLARVVQLSLPILAGAVVAAAVLAFIPDAALLLALASAMGYAAVAYGRRVVAAGRIGAPRASPALYVVGRQPLYGC